MSVFKLALVSAVLASTALACSAASTTDSSVELEVDTDQLDVACVKGGGLCSPTTSPTTSPKGGGFVLDSPVAGPRFTCTGAGPEGDGAEYRVLGAYNNKQCWSSRPLEVVGGIPWGFSLLSLYICPAAYPVNRCDAYGRCTCWSY